MPSMSRQYHDGIVKKTYVALVNDIPEEQYETSITSQQARQLGVDIDKASSNDDMRWQLIDAPLDDKDAVTVWRAVDYAPSIHANDGTLTRVELKPKTGRYHQLRRHLTWHRQRPIVGDDTYDGGTTAARKFRDRGLFLFATRVTHQHPYYNTAQGRAEWDQLPADDERKFADGTLWLLPTDDQVMVTESTTTSLSCTKLKALDAVMDSGIARHAMAGLRLAMARQADSALLQPTVSMPCNTCRCKLDTSTVS